MLLKDVEWEEGRLSGVEEAHQAFWTLFEAASKGIVATRPFFKLWLLLSLTPLCAIDVREGRKEGRVSRARTALLTKFQVRAAR